MRVFTEQPKECQNETGLIFNSSTNHPITGNALPFGMTSPFPWRPLEEPAGNISNAPETDGSEPTFLYTLLNFNAYEGKRIATQEVVYRDETVPPKHFLVFRFVTCFRASDDQIGWSCLHAAKLGDQSLLPIHQKKAIRRAEKSDPKKFLDNQMEDPLRPIYSRVQ